MEMYVTENCVICDQAKNIILGIDIDINIIQFDGSKREHRDLHIMWAPTIIDGDKRYSGPEVINFLQSRAWQ